MTIQNDALDYYTLSKSILKGSYPNTEYPPGYPLFVALMGSPEAVVVAQIILHLSSICLVYLIAKRFSRKVALIAAALYLFEPVSWYLSIQVLTETLFTFFFLLSFYLLIKRMHTLSGIALGLAIYVRPIAQFFPAIVMPFAWKTTLVAIMSIAPWVTHNYVEYDKLFYTTHGQTGINYWNAPMLESHIAGIPFVGGHKKYVPASYIFEHPLEYAEIHLKGMARTLFTTDIVSLIEVAHIKYPPSLVYDSPPTMTERFIRLMRQPLPEIVLKLGMAGIYNGITVLIVALAGLGSVLMYRNGDKFLSLLMVTTILYFIFLPGPFGYDRFRVPIVPYICILAGYTARETTSYISSHHESAGKGERG